eukprot:Rhum_TRINITY_DN14342_c28_g1::Rhum_TRINITY_DN14342_c28_g1_i1::g.81276::m.81276
MENQSSPNRERARAAMMRYVDEFVGVIIRVATEAPDPLHAIGEMLSGDGTSLAAAASSNEVRALLFAAFNQYDDQNRRTLSGDALYNFFCDFVACFSGSIAALGPDLATAPDESWEDRSRWDEMGQELSARAARLRGGFLHDSDVWVRRWASALDTTRDGRGLRYSEVQTAFAGARAGEWLAEVNCCAQLTDLPAVQLPLTAGGSGVAAAALALCDAPGSAREPSLTGSHAPATHLSAARRRAAESARRARRQHGSAPPPEPEMTFDVGDAACALHEELRQRQGVLYTLYYALYFALLVAVLLAHGGSAPHAAHELLAERLAAAPFEPRRSLSDVRTVADVHGWLEGVWAPALFTDAPQRRVAGSSVLAASPYLRQRRKSRKTACKEPVDIAVFEGGECLGSGFSGAPIVSQKTVGKQYPPVECDKAYHAPLYNGTATPDARDFLVSFVPAGSGGVRHWERAAASAAAAQAALVELREDGWLSHETAFLEASALLYHPDSDVLAVSRVVFVVTKSGSVLPLAGKTAPYWGQHGGSVLLARRASRWDHETDAYALLVVEGVLVFVTLVELLALETTRWYRSWCRAGSAAAYFSESLWHPFQLLFYMVFSTYAGLYVSHTLLPRPGSDVRTLDGFSNNGLDPVFPVLLVFGGILITLATLRMLRYAASLGASVRLVAGVLAAAALPLVSVFVLFLVAVAVFATIGFYYFGHGHRSFSTMGSAVQMMVTFFTHGMDYSLLASPLSDPSRGAFATVYYWALVVVLMLLFLSLFVAVFIAAYDSVADSADRKALVSRDVPSQGRLWSRRSLLYQFRNYPSLLLGVWRSRQWVAPVAMEHPLRVVASAEVVGKGNLRVILTTGEKEAMASCSGVVFLLPSEMLRYDAEVRRDQLVDGHALVTRCRSGREPRMYSKPDWCQYLDEWWMDDRYVHDFLQKGQHWMGVAEGVVDAFAGPAEVHRRAVWLAERAKGSVARSADPQHFGKTQFVRFSTGAYRSRVLRIEEHVRGLLDGAGWEHESLVFEFRGVVSQRWIASMGGADVKSLPVRGVYKTYTPPELEDKGEAVGSKLVVVLGDQPVPSYICCERERFSGRSVKRNFTESVQPFIDEMVIGRFGISSEKAAFAI